MTDLLWIKWKSEEGYEMAFRKNIWFCSTHFQVKIKNKSLVALLVTEMKRLRCAGLPQSCFCNLTRAALLLRLLSVTHLWKEGFQSLSRSLSRLSNASLSSPTGFPQVQVVLE